MKSLLLIVVAGWIYVESVNFSGLLTFALVQAVA